jgi:hypothetical protein
LVNPIHFPLAVRASLYLKKLRVRGGLARACLSYYAGFFDPALLLSDEPSSQDRAENDRTSMMEADVKDIEQDGARRR